jgi:predicted PurR-regulated permease PerM
VLFSLIFLSLALGLLSFFVLKPFLSPISWAVALSIVFYPVYAFICRYIKWRSIASAITLAVILVIVLGPFSYVSFLLATELKDVAGFLEGGDMGAIGELLEHPKAAWLIERVQTALNIEDEDMGRLLTESLSKIGKQLLSKVTEGAKNALIMLLNFIFMSFSIFFLLRDGPAFIKRINNYLPFSDEHKLRLEGQIKGIVVSTVYGGVVVALVQGAIGGAAFYFLDIPSPAIWGTAMAVMSFVPLLGTFSIWGPATVYLFMIGQTGQGIALALIGTFGISMVDNILKPLIISGRTKMPTLIIFFSVLGGIKLFGLIGLIAGPLVVALFISVVEIFRNLESEGGSNA